MTHAHVHELRSEVVTAVQRRTAEDAEDAKIFRLKISAFFAFLAVASGDSSPKMPQR